MAIRVPVVIDAVTALICLRLVPAKLSRRECIDHAGSSRIAPLDGSLVYRGHFVAHLGDSVCKRWTLQLLEEAVVELNIVERASDNTIGRTLKKTRSSRTYKNNGSSRRMPTRRS